MVGKKLKRKVFGGKFKAGDMISRLPDEVIGMILSLLTLKEATQTCLLSHRWERLWQLYNGSLLFDFTVAGFHSNEHERSKFIDTVNQILASIHVGNMNEFILHTDSDQIPKSHVDAWVAFAFNRGVQKLDIRVSCYTFRADLFCAPTIQPTTRLYTIYSALKSLRLYDVDVSGDRIEYFLSNCPLLEGLFVCISLTLINLKVIGAAATFRLKYLEILYCHKMKYLELSAPNLVSFKYGGPIINLKFANNHPKLLDLAIGGEDVIDLVPSFSSYFTRIETLTLNFELEDHWEFTQCLKFTRVKHLTLTVEEADSDDSLLGWTTLIRCCPLLQKFTLELDHVYPSGKRKLETVAGHPPHENLKVAEVVGFCGYPIDRELLMYLVASSTALEKVILNCCKPYATDEGWGWCNIAASVAEIAAFRRGTQLLKKKLPPTVELVLIE